MNSTLWVFVSHITHHIHMYLLVKGVAQVVEGRIELPKSDFNARFFKIYLYVYISNTATYFDSIIK